MSWSLVFLETTTAFHYWYGKTITTISFYNIPDLKERKQTIQVFPNSEIGTLNCMCAIKKWYSWRPLQQSIPPHSPASSLVFMLGFKLSYLSSAILIPSAVNHSHLQLYYFLPCLSPGFHRLLLWYRSVSDVLICWFSRVAMCQTFCVSHISDTWFFLTHHVVKQGWGKKHMPGFCYIYRDDATEEDSCTHTETKNTQ